jgi:type II secretory pathway pseudopilin PulG
MKSRVSKYFKMKNLFFTSENSGFSLLEVIFSIGIITVGVISILTLFNYNLKAEINNKNKLIAIYLAQESIEVVRQQRDNIWFGGDADFLDENEFSDGECIVFLKDTDIINKGWKIETPSAATYKKVYINNGYYVQKNNNAPGGWQETGFERYLTIENNSGGGGVNGCDINSCARIISHVSFNGTEIVTVTAYLYDDWY